MVKSAAACDSSIATVFRASPNYGERRGPFAPDAIILHYTGMNSAEAALALLCNPASGVSCHYVVLEDGGIVQLVRESARAWHAGDSFWQGHTDLNSASIGIEIVNAGHDGGLPPFADAQIESVVALCRDLSQRYSIIPARVLAHSDIAPSRKRDPGERFPWSRLAKAGVGVWRESDQAKAGPTMNMAGVQTMLARYGYKIEQTGVLDARTRAVVVAFQRHFRPAHTDGELDPQTVSILSALVQINGPEVGGDQN